MADQGLNGLALGFGLGFADLYARDGLVRLDAAFLDHMVEADGDLAERLATARDAPDEGDAAALMVDLAPHLDDFIGALFAITAELRSLAISHDALAPLYACKRLFVQRRAAKKVPADRAAALDGAALEDRLEALLGESVSELAFARAVMGWLDDEAGHEEALDLAMNFAAWALHSLTGRARDRKSVV